LPARQPTAEELLSRGNLPRHIAIIMDGNGRWARARGVPRLFGHRAGRESVREAVKGCVALGVEVLTLYTFSIENWKRPKREVDALMGILQETLRAEREELRANNVRLAVIGRTQDLPASVRKAIAETQSFLSGSSGLRMILALSYSGRAEVVDAIRAILREDTKAPIDPAAVTRRSSRTTSTPRGCRIRTSDPHQRRAPDLELHAVAAGLRRAVDHDTLWPDFRRRHLYQAVADYQRRERRFGRVD
jgi:undecaprenyl diphosphate synthase